MKIPLKRRRKRQWLPWTPDEGKTKTVETAAAATTVAATTVAATAETTTPNTAAASSAADLHQTDVWGNIETQTWFSISDDFTAEVMQVRTGMMR